MQPIRQIVENMPEYFQVPPEVRHQRVEIIMWPLDKALAQDTQSVGAVSTPTAHKSRTASALAGLAGYRGPHISDDDLDAARFATDMEDAYRAMWPILFILAPILIFISC